jgi:hypothetical protein
MKVENVNSPSFRALPVSNIKLKGLNSNYKLFECTKEDSKFLEDLAFNMNLKKFMPNLPSWQLELWGAILRHSIILEDTNKILVAACDNVPCGIINYFPSDEYYRLNYLVALPVKTGYRAPLSGQVMCNELFRRFLKSDAPKIELTALHNTPFDPISKYRKMGFFPVCEDGYSSFMRGWRDEITKTFEEQNYYISAEHIENPQDVDLGKELSVLV